MRPIAEIDLELANTRLIVKEMQSDTREMHHDRFVRKGGCNTCGGRGWVIDNAVLQDVKQSMDVFTIDAYLACCCRQKFVELVTGSDEAQETLEMLGHDESLHDSLVYPPCPNPSCTPETRTASGLDSYWTKHDGYHGLNDPTCKSDVWKAMSRDLLKQVRELEIERASTKRMNMSAKKHARLDVHNGKMGKGAQKIV